MSGWPQHCGIKYAHVLLEGRRVGVCIDPPPFQQEVPWRVFLVDRCPVRTFDPEKDSPSTIDQAERGRFERVFRCQTGPCGSYDVRPTGEISWVLDWGRLCRVSGFIPAYAWRFFCMNTSRCRVAIEPRVYWSSNNQWRFRCPKSPRDASLDLLHSSWHQARYELFKEEGSEMPGVEPLGGAHLDRPLAFDHEFEIARRAGQSASQAIAKHWSICKLCRRPCSDPAQSQGG